MRLLLAPLMAIGLTGCDLEGMVESTRYKEDFHNAYNMKSGGRVEVENFNGSIEITGWEKESVDITATKSASNEDLLKQINIDIQSTPDSIRIRSERPAERRGNMGVRYVIRVPQRVILERIVSSNGALRIENIEGNARLRTSNGSVRVIRVNGMVEATTSNGAVEARDLSGGALLRTSNGGIRADGVRGSFDATTSNGSVDARLGEMEASKPVRVESSNGSITLAVASYNNNEIRANTSNAGITLRMPSNVNARLRASTSSASVHSDFQVLTSRASKSRLEGNIGSGGPVIDLTTSNGSIQILRQ